jgi:hypothetical protein
MEFFRVIDRNLMGLMVKRDEHGHPIAHTARMIFGELVLGVIFGYVIYRGYLTGHWPNSFQEITELVLFPLHSIYGWRAWREVRMMGYTPEVSAELPKVQIPAPAIHPPGTLPPAGRWARAREEVRRTIYGSKVGN